MPKPTRPFLGPSRYSGFSRPMFRPTRYSSTQAFSRSMSRPTSTQPFQAHIQAQQAHRHFQVCVRAPRYSGLFSPYQGPPGSPSRPRSRHTRYLSISKSITISLAFSRSMWPTRYSGISRIMSRPFTGLSYGPCVVVLLHNSGSCNACTIKQNITLLCIPKQSMWQNGAVP